MRSIGGTHYVQKAKFDWFYCTIDYVNLQPRRQQKMIDEKGRLFGKINIVDLLVIW